MACLGGIPLREDGVTICEEKTENDVMNCAPICLFVYKRLDVAKQTISSLQENVWAENSDLFVFSDAAQKESDIEQVKSVRRFLYSLKGFKSISITEAATNMGLEQSIILGVSQILEKYDNVIVLEDDVVPQKNFLVFMNKALQFYRDDKLVQTVNGFSLFVRTVKQDVYFQTRPFPWGWATWRDRWDVNMFDKESLKRILRRDEEILFYFKRSCGNDLPRMLLDSLEGKNSSWDVRWMFHHFYSNRITVYPRLSLSMNIGYESEGIHCKGINVYHSKMDNSQRTDFSFLPARQPSVLERKLFLRYVTFSYKLFQRVKMLLRKEGRKRLWRESLLRLKGDL